MCLDTAPGSSAQNGPLCRLETGHVGTGSTVGPQGPGPAGHPTKLHALDSRTSPQPGTLSRRGPSPAALLTLLAAGTGESRGAHALAVQVMADTSMQAAGAFLGTVWSPAPCPTAWRDVLSATGPHPPPTAAEDWGSPGSPQEVATGLPASRATHHLRPLLLTPHDEPEEGAA